LKFSLTSSTIVIQDNIVNGVISDPFGDIAYYSFNDTLTSPLVNSISIQDVDRKDAYTEDINLNLFVVPSMTFSDDSNPKRPRFVVRAAVRLSFLFSPSYHQLLPLSSSYNSVSGH